jgi:endonuclease/exonuclease/phosphatase family metal-dependent hydrolase
MSEFLFLETNRFFLALFFFPPFSGSPFAISQDGSALHNSNRQLLQCARIKSLCVLPDVMCFQEVMSDPIRRVYLKQFAPDYECLSFDRVNIFGYSSYVLLLLIICTPLFAATIIFSVMFGWRSLIELLGCFEELGLNFAGIIDNVVPHLLISLTTATAHRFISRATIGDFLTGCLSCSQLILYKRSLKLLEARQILFAEQGGDFMNWWRPRGFIFALFELSNGAIVGVLNAHTNALPCTKVTEACPISDSHRITQMHEMCKFAKQEATKRNCTILIAGDMNALPEFEEVLVMEKEGFHNAFTDANPKSKCVTWSQYNPLANVFQVGAEDYCLDYIFYRPAKQDQVINLRCDVVLNSAPYVSDHFGLLASVDIQSP